MKTNWKGKRVLILGGGRQGQALARWLTRHGARVTVNDRQSSEAMRAAQATLADLPVTWALGGHPIELLDGADVVCLSGGVPLANPIVAEAIKRGIPRELRASAPASGMIRFSINARSLGLPVSPELPW